MGLHVSKAAAGMVCQILWLAESYPFSQLILICWAFILRRGFTPSVANNHFNLELLIQFNQVYAHSYLVASSRGGLILPHSLIVRLSRVLDIYCLLKV